MVRRPPVLAAAIIGVAMMAAAAHAQAPKTFSVHFDENQTAIPKDGQAALGAAVEMAQECAKAQVMLVGHDDGAKADEVSLARANAVRTAIVNAGGVNAGDIKVEGRGAKQLKVSAPNSQNRRVDISVSCK
ncbi:MAG TPA: OmpA family protein [Hyphomonadaceae bacterium]|nr:OmpA family protein [Hyphomonadaceae bacterium]